MIWEGEPLCRFADVAAPKTNLFAMAATKGILSTMPWRLHCHPRKLYKNVFFWYDLKFQTN